MLINSLDTVEWDLLFGFNINLKMLLFSSCPGLKLPLKLYELLVLFIFLHRFPFVFGILTFYAAGSYRNVNLEQFCNAY